MDDSDRLQGLEREVGRVAARRTADHPPQTSGHITPLKVVCSHRNERDVGTEMSAEIVSERAAMAERAAKRKAGANI